jgi:chemotaxis protein methyltransferase CheR
MKQQRNSNHPAVDSNSFDRLVSDDLGYQNLANFLKSRSGIHMPPTAKNQTLMASRLSKVLARFQIDSYRQLHRALERGDAHLEAAFIQALTTNKTEFFREQAHFQLFPRLLEQRLEAKRQSKSPKEIRIWCAAASRGHEPYTILFTLLRSGFDLQLWRLKFLASDIDLVVLKQAATGVYSEREMEGIPSDIQVDYFKEIAASGGERQFAVRRELRDMITFAPFNLVEIPYAFQFPFDFIFCRNVLIYFDEQTVRKVKDALTEALAPEGVLFIGHSETGGYRPPALETIAMATLRKKG